MWTFVMQAIDTLALNLQDKWVFVVQAIDTLAVTLQNKWVFIMQAIDTLVLNLQNRWVFVTQAIDTLALNLKNKYLFVMQAIGTLALNLQNKWVFVMQAIDTLALNLQNKWVFPHCLAFAKDAIQSGDSNIRAAACTVLVVVAEGCCDACTSHLSDVLQVCPLMLFPRISFCETSLQCRNAFSLSLGISQVLK